MEIEHDDEWRQISGNNTMKWESVESHPSTADRPWSTLELGGTMGGRSTLEAPTFHYSLEAMTNARKHTKRMRLYTGTSEF